MVMQVEVNWLAVFLATASSMVVGYVWYHKQVFGTSWMKLAKLSEKELNDSNKMMSAMGKTVVASFFTAFILAHVAFLSHQFYNNSFMQDTITTAFWLWLGFTAARILTHDAFERRPTTLTVLAVGHELVTVLVMALIIGAFGV
jgi:hypothetical protein